MSVSVIKCTIANLDEAPNIKELLEEYADECSIDGLPHPNAKTETYKNLERTGWLHTFGAWQDGKLIGFILVLYSVLPHYNAQVATVESFFVQSGARRTGAGIMLRNVAELFAKTNNSPGILITAPSGSALDRILELSKDYQETNRVYFKSFL